MTNEEDRLKLLEFSSRHGSALRMVLAHKDYIARWLEEGWSKRAILSLLKSKGITVVGRDAFSKAIKKVFGTTTSKKNAGNEKTSSDGNKQKQKTQPRPHEMHRQQAQKFVTMAGMDHIGLDKKDES